MVEPLAFLIVELRSSLRTLFKIEEADEFFERSDFIPVFREMYSAIAGPEAEADTIQLSYVSQLQNRDILESLKQTRSRDLILGWTSQGIHKDELEMTLAGYPLKQVGSQGQQKTFLLALKLAQALFLTQRSTASGEVVRPILLLDDIFDKLDSQRVERILRLVASDRFGQIFITDTDRQHLSTLLSQSLSPSPSPSSSPSPSPSSSPSLSPSPKASSLFLVSNGQISPL